jgi:hypothetical protein
MQILNNYILFVSQLNCNCHDFQVVDKEEEELFALAKKYNILLK